MPSTPVSPVQKEGSGAMSSQGSGTPAFMAIPALGSPQQNGKSKANGSRPGMVTQHWPAEISMPTGVLYSYQARWNSKQIPCAINATCVARKIGDRYLICLSGQPSLLSLLRELKSSPNL